MNIQSALITAVKCLITGSFGYQLDWIKYLYSTTGLGSDWITQLKYWIGIAKISDLFNTIIQPHILCLQYVHHFKLRHQLTFQAD